MRWIHILWDADDDPNGNVQHIADNYLTKEDYVAVVYEEIDDDTVRPVTAYFVEE